VDVVGVAGGSLLVVIIEAPHSLHTHRRSTSYIYKVFQQLLWLVVIRMQIQPDICLDSHTVVAVGVSLGFSLAMCCGYDWGTPHTSYS
jgi:hypothetical protein